MKENDHMLITEEMLDDNSEYAVKIKPPSAASLKNKRMKAEGKLLTLLNKMRRKGEV